MYEPADDVEAEPEYCPQNEKNDSEPDECTHHILQQRAWCPGLTTATDGAVNVERHAGTDYGESSMDRARCVDWPTSAGSAPKRDRAA